MRVAIGSDHAGFALKGELCSLLDEMRVEYRDFGTFSDEPVDYPDFIAPVARAVARGDFEFGIVIGGSGTGEAIVANKVRGIRCVQATNPVVARLAREHNDANVHLLRRADRRDRGGAGLRARVPGRHVPGRPSRAAAGEDRAHRGRGGGSLGAWPWRSTTTSVRCWPATTARVRRWLPAWWSARRRCSAPSG